MTNYFSFGVPLPAAPVPVTPVMPVTPMMPVPAMMAAPAVMTMPAHLGGQLAGIILHRSGDAGTCQRQGLRALGRCCEDEQSADGEEAQNSLHVHVYPPWLGGDIPTSCGNLFPLATTLDNEKLEGAT